MEILLALLAVVIGWVLWDHNQKQKAKASAMVAETVKEEEPYKVETPVVAEVAAPVVEAPAPVVEAPAEKPTKAKKPRVGKAAVTAAKAADAKKKPAAKKAPAKAKAPKKKTA